MRVLAIGAAILAMIGCSSKTVDATCPMTGPGNPEQSLLASLRFQSGETWTCSSMVAGTPGGPQPVVDVSTPMVITPGATFSMRVTWSGGPISNVEIGIGNGAFVTVPVDSNGLFAGTVLAPVSVDPDVCNNLHAICHQLICCQQVVTAGGKLSAAQATAMILDCTGGVGCPAIGYPTPPSSCACDSTWQDCSGTGQTPCGFTNQACCSNDSCNGVGLSCQKGTCVAMPGANTGAPCLTAIDCGGTGPACITKDSNGIAWPDGYCSSKCNPTKNDPMSGVNSSCPGLGTCIGYGVTGQCETPCTKTSPCTRTGYSCFSACEPTAESQCNPTVRGSCPQDGGSSFESTDLGLVQLGRTCVRIGVDDVGQCDDGCDPFAQNCPPDVQQQLPQGCYASVDTGEGACQDDFGTMQGDGATCYYVNDCDPGFACEPGGPGGASGTCRAYCGGPNAVACSNGQTCTDLSPTVSQSTIGICLP